jgi:outer membrane protein W
MLNMLIILGFQLSGYAETIKEPIPGETYSKKTFLSAGPGIAIFNRNIGWAINVGIISALNNTDNLFVGADLGLNFWGNNNSLLSSVGTRSYSATGIQLLPTVVYRFDLTGGGVLFPYIGASVGPHVFIEQTSVTASGVTAQETNSALLFELLLRGGFYTHLSNTVSLNMEVKGGILKTDFIFLPQVNAVIAL